MMRRAMALLAALVWMAGAAMAAETMDLEAFTEAYRDALEAAAPEFSYAIEAPDIVVTLEDGGTVAINPENAYAEYAQGADLDEVLDYFVRVNVSVMRDEVDAGLTEKNVLPVLRSAAYIEYLEGLEFAPVYEPFVEGIVTLYVVDTPEAIRPFDVAELEESGIARDDLHALAMANLADVLPPLEKETYEGVTMLIADGMFESSVLLWADFDAYVDVDVAGDLVVAVPARDAVFVAGSEDEQGIGIVRELVEAIYPSAGYPVSETLLRWTEEGFVTYTP